MAKVISPLHSAEARGKVEGLVFNTWRGLNTVKTFKSPAQPRTSIQLTRRAHCVQMARAWGGLTDNQRTAWNAYAVAHPDIDWTGSPMRLSGFNWYIRCNTRILTFAETPIDDPPVAVAPPPFADFLAGDGILQSILTWTFGDGAANRFFIYGTSALSAGIQAKRERAVIVGYGTASMGTITLSSLKVGRYTFWGVVINTDTGLASTYVSDIADITAA